LSALGDHFISHKKVEVEMYCATKRGRIWYPT